MGKITKYDAMIEKALMTVVKQVFQSVASNGTFASHELYLTVSTPKIKAAPRIKTLYPEQLSLLIQNNHSDMKVTDDDITVTLGLVTGIETVIIPWEAIVEYIDNTEQYALQFKHQTVCAYNDDEISKHENIVQFHKD